MNINELTQLAPDPEPPEVTAAHEAERRRGELLMTVLPPLAVSLLGPLADCLAAYRPDCIIVIPCQPEKPGTLEFRAVPKE